MKTAIAGISLSMTSEQILDSPAPGLPAPENVEREPTRPVDYGALNAAYGTLLAGLLVAASRRSDRLEPIEGSELLVMGTASFALSKVVAREKIGTWMREPFVEQRGGRRRPRGRRLRHAVGELVTCTRCVGAWSALAIVGLRVASPPAGRVAATVLATSGVNDFLQATFRLLCDEANSAPAPDAAP